MIRSIRYTILCSVFASLACGDLLINGNFETGGIDGGENAVQIGHIDTGWVAKNGWVIESGFARNADGFSTGEYGGLSQVVSVGPQTGTSLTLSVDWAPVASPTTNTSLELNYQIIGWTLDTPGVTATNPAAGYFWGQNYPSSVISHGDNTASWDDLMTPGKQTNSGQWSAGNAAFVGTAGVTNTFVVSTELLDLSTYDYVGVRLATTSGSDIGGSIDNVSLSVVPEPGSLGLMALMGTALWTYRRRFR